MKTKGDNRKNSFSFFFFYSLADVYEGALRNVLGIQLHLTLDDQQSFAQDTINDLLFRDKSSSSQNRSSRQENLKRRSENYQTERLGEESKDVKNSASFQGRTLLRDPRRMSPGCSAFHVPPKKARMDEEMKYAERSYPMDRYGVPHPGPNFPSDYSNLFPSPRGSPGMYHRRLNGSEAVTHVYRTNGMHIPVARDHYSPWPVFGHHRDVPTLFPVRCSVVENERRFHRGFVEEEKRRRMDLACLNGFAHEKTSVRVKIEETKGEYLKRDQKPSPTDKRSSSTPEKDIRLEKPLGEREKLSPASPSKSKSNALLTSCLSSRSSPVNHGTGAIDFRMETRYRSALRKMESRREGRKGRSEDAKEEFLFKLGLERIEAWTISMLGRKTAGVLSLWIRTLLEVIFVTTDRFDI